jgi:hypothetical protein
VIDVAAPVDSADLSDCFDELCSVSDPLPSTAQYSRYDCSSMIVCLLSRAEKAVSAVADHATRTNGAWLQVGLEHGLWTVLRFAEFCRRLTRTPKYHQLSDRVDLLRKRMELVLPKEMWRRWATASFHISWHKNGSDLLSLWKIYMEVQMRDTVGPDKVSSTCMFSLNF